MEKHVADNSTFFREYNRAVNQQIFDAAMNTAESMILEEMKEKDSLIATKLGPDFDLERDRRLYYNDHNRWKYKHRELIMDRLKKILDSNVIPQVRAKTAKNVITSAESSLVITGARMMREAQYKDIDTEALVGAIGLENLKNIANIESPKGETPEPATEAPEPVTEVQGEPATSEAEASTPAEHAELVAETPSDDIAKKKSQTNANEVRKQIITKRNGMVKSDGSVISKENSNEDISDLAPETAGENIEVTQGSTASAETEAVSNKHNKSTAETSNEPSVEMQPAETPNESASPDNGIAKRKERLQKQGVDVKINAEKIGKFMSFDLRNNVATEFAFLQHWYDTGANVYDGRFGSIVGFTEEQRDYSLQLIDKARSGEELTKEESSWIDHLALTGKNRANEAAPGVFRHPEFNREISSNFRLRYAEIGTKDYFKIGEKQRELGPTTEYAGKKMYAWEAEFFSGIDLLADGETVIVYGEDNSSIEDINKLIENGLWSEGANEYAKEQQVAPKEIMGVALSKDKDFILRSPGENADLAAKTFTSPEERLTDEQRAEYKELFESESLIEETSTMSSQSSETAKSSSSTEFAEPNNKPDEPVTEPPSEPAVEHQAEPTAESPSESATKNEPRTSTVSTPNGDIVKTKTELNYQPTSWRVSQSDADMVAGVQNTIDKGKFVAWDTETLGGLDEFGKQRYNAVTEFTFKLKEYNAEAKTISSFGSAVGLTDEQYTFGEQVWKKVRAGAKLTDQEEVWAHRLALIGKSKYEQAKNKEKGIFEYAHFADKDEILKLNPDEIKTGLEKAYTMGKEQRDAGLIKYDGEKMYAWESELFKGIDTIINGDLTAVGHNTVNFDRKALQWLLQHGMWSEGAKKIAEKRLENLTSKNGDLHFNHEFDTMAAQNQHAESRLDNYITTDENGKAVVNEEALEFAKRRKLSAGQQEAIGYSLYKDMYEGADVNAHASDVDVDVVSKIFTSEKYGLGKNSFLRDAKDTKSYKIKGDSSQLFYMTRGYTTKDLSNRGLLGFVTGEVRDSITTLSGYEHVSEDGRKLIFHPGAIQKGVSYSIGNVTALSMSEELQKQVAKAQPNADMKNLIAITLNPEYHKDIDPGYFANRSITLVGSRFDIETTLNETGLLYGTKNENGEYVFTDDEKIQKALAFSQIDERGYLTGTRTTVNKKGDHHVIEGKTRAATIDDMLKESSETLRDSSVLRTNRERSLKKDMGLLQYIEDMRAWGAENGADDLKNRFMEQVASGNTKRSFADYFGYEDFKSKKQFVENTTLATALNRVDYIIRNEKTIRDAAQRALEDAGSSQTVEDVLASDIYRGVNKNASYYYKSYMDAITDLAAYRDKANVGLIENSVHNYELNYVEIDMNSFRNGKYGNFTDPFRINLNAGGKTNFRELAMFLGENPRMHEDEAVSLLADFQKFLVNSRSLNTFSESAIKRIKDEQTNNFKINPGKENIDFAFAKIAYSLKQAKDQVPTGGLLTATERYALVDHKDEFGISDAERKIIFDEHREHIAKQIKASKEADEIFAREATNKILYNGITDIKEVKQKFMEYGYTEHDALKAAYIREQQRRDTQYALEKIAGAARYYGGNMGMDAKSGEIFIDANGERTVLNRLLQNVMENGMSFVESGNMRFLAPVGLYATNKYRYERGIDNKLEYKFMSKIGAEFENMKWFYSSFERYANQGRLSEGVQQFINKLANNVSESASVLAEDFQEMRMAGNVDISEILPLIAREDVWHDISSKINYDDPYKGEANRLLRDAVEKIQQSNGKGIEHRYLPGDYKEFSTSVGIITALRDIMPELHSHLGPESQDMMRKILGDNYQDYGLDPKAAGKGHINVFRSMHQYGNDYTSTKRGAPDYTGRAEKFYTDRSALDGEVKGVEFGRAINTEVGHIYEKDAGKGVTREVSDVMRAGRIRMATGTVKQIAANADLPEEIRTALLGIHLTEGAAVIDPRVVDAFFNYNKAVQRIREAKVEDFVDNKLDHFKEKAHMAPHIWVNRDGTVGFRYAEGVSVETEELGGKSPLSTKGPTGRSVPVEIKEAGVMRLGFFSNKNNLLVSESDIQKVLNQKDNAEKIRNAADSTTEAYRILKQEFGAFYYNTGLDAKSNLKMEEYWEKGMHDALFGRLGRGGKTEVEKDEDKQMAKALRALGAEGLMDDVLHRDFIESFKSKDISSTVLGAYFKSNLEKINTIRKEKAEKEGKEYVKLRQLDHQTIIGVMAEAMGLEGPEAAHAGEKLFDIAVRERYRPWDELMGVLQKAGGYTDEQIQGIHSISNYMSNGVTKHAEMANNVAVNLLAKGYTPEEVVGIMEKEHDGIGRAVDVGALQVKEGKDGTKIIVGDPEKVNLTALQKIAKDEKLENESVFWTGNGKILRDNEFQLLSDDEKRDFKKNKIGYSAIEMSRGSDADRARIVGLDEGKWKYDYRSQAMADVDRYSVRHLQDIKTGLIESLGEEGKKKYEEYFADGKVKIGARTGEGFYQDLERARWYTPGKRYTPGKENDSMRVLIHGDFDESLLTKEEKEEIEKAYQRLEESGVDRHFTDAVVNAARAGYKNNGVHVEGSNADYVSVDKVKAYYSAHQHVLADSFNKGDKTMEQVVKEGFGNGQVINLQDLFTATSNFEEAANHLYGKSAFLDLQINGGKGQQIYKDESKRFIAIPWTDQNLFPKDGEILKNEYQSTAFRMYNTLQRLQSGVDEKGKPLTDEQKQTYLNNLSGLADDMKKAVVHTAFGKEGLVHREIGSSVIGMSYFGKAYGHEILGATDAFWGKIKFDGQNVQEMYQKGAYIDYQAASIAVRNRFFNDDYFKQLGLGDDALDVFKEGFYKRLETSGTLSTNSRNPQGYDKSTSAAVMYYSNAITGNNLVVSEAMWESKKGDYDSDEGIAHVLTGDAVIKKNGKRYVAQVDFATFKQLKQMAGSGVGGIEDITLSSHAERSFQDARAQILGQAVTRNKLAFKNVAKDSSRTEVDPEFQYEYLNKEALEGGGEYYKGPKHVVDGTRYRDLDASERTLMASQYEGFMEEARTWKGIDNKTFENMKAEEQRNLYAGYIHNKFGMETDTGKAAMEALGFTFTERREIQNAAAKTRNAATGQMNNTVFRLVQVANASGQFFEDDSIRGIAAIHTALNEAFLTPKNNAAGLGNLTDIQELRNAANRVYELIGAAHPNKKAIKEADEKLEELAYKALVDRDFRELRRYVPGFDDAMGKYDEKTGYTDAQKKFSREYVHNTFGVIGQRINAAGFDFKALDIGMKDNKEYSSSLKYAYGGMANSSVTDMGMQAMELIGEQYGGAAILKENAPIGGGRKDFQKTIEAGQNFESNVKSYENALKDSGESSSPLRDSSHVPPPTVGEVGRDAARILSNVKISGKGIAKTVAAIAGGLMASGYAGGVNTTSPQSATTQAAGANEALQEYQVPQLSDGNMNVLRGGPQSGYVINISAGSPQGSDAARNAITQALGSSVPVNTSMNINMNTNYQDQVNQLQISRILENMM